MTTATRKAKLERLVQAIRRNAARPGDTVEQQRGAFEAALAEMAVAPGVTTTTATVHDIRVEWLVPEGDELAGTLLYLHGGGYVIGSLDTIRPLASHLAVAARARVLTIDYRLAPEHPFPAALEDAVSAYEWLVAEGINASRLAIAGDSAGGGLTVATLTALRERGRPLPAGGVCLSPWTDLSLPPGSMDDNASSDPQVQRWMLEEMASHYLGDAHPRTPLASPMYADLHGLPPLLIHAGRDEALLDDAVGLARAATAAGVDVTLDCWENMIHVWHGYAPVLAEANDALRDVGEWLVARWKSPKASATSVGGDQNEVPRPFPGA